MPLPKPRKNEKQDDFISRCMSNETMKKEYGDNDQRLAICFSQWRKKEKKDEDMKMETRDFELVEIRYNKGSEGESPKLTGYAAVFNSLSEDLYGFKEKIAPGAFADTIQKDDIRALWNHDKNYVLGRTKSGTLRLEEDERGLKIEIDPPDTTWANDLMASIDRKDVNQMSFGFHAIRDTWDDQDKKMPVRTLEEVKLIDISPVTFPAYKSTQIQTRELLENAGLDLSIISRVLVKREHGLEITEEDRTEIDTIIETLRELQPKVESDQKNEHSADETNRKEALKRERELQLKQKSMAMEV